MRAQTIIIYYYKIAVVIWSVANNITEQSIEQEQFSINLLSCKIIMKQGGVCRGTENYG